MNRLLKKIFFLLAVLGVSAVTHAQPLEVKSHVNKTSLAVYDQLALVVECSGSAARGVDRPAPPELEHFDYAGFGGTSQNIQFVNGQMSASVSYTFHYRATSEGESVIPAIEIEHDGKTYSSDPIQIKITSASAAQNSSGGSTNLDGVDLFLRAVVDKQRVYQNEPVTVTFRIYSKVRISGLQLAKAPETAGFWSEDLDVGKELTTRQEIIQGQQYAVADVKKMALFPTSSGSKTIGSLALDCNVRVSRQRRSRDPFDTFFNDPFLSRTVKKTIASDPVTIQVEALPKPGQPSDFEGAVGSFDLSAHIDKKNVETNEAVTLTVTYSGEGNFNLIHEPDLQIPPDFEQYEPKVREDISRKTRVGGSKTFEYVLIPRFPGEQQVPALQFSYFDPDRETYITRSTPEFTIQVTPGEQPAATVSGGGWSKEEVQLIGQDIRFIKVNHQGFREIGYHVYSQPWFLGLLMVPVLLLAGAVGIQHQQQKMNTNQAYARRRRANKMAQRRLSQAKKLLSTDKQSEFYGEVSRAVTGFIADKLDISRAGLITSELERQLRQRQVDPEQIRHVIDLMQSCDFYRFGQGSVSKEEMESFYRRAKEQIIALDKSLGT
jgi:hypothetical protein